MSAHTKANPGRSRVIGWDREWPEDQDLTREAREEIDRLLAKATADGTITQSVRKNRLIWVNAHPGAAWRRVRDRVLALLPEGARPWSRSPS